MEKCCDNYSTTFDSYSAMLAYQRTQTENSQWLRSPVNELSVEALEPKRLDYERSEFAYGVGEEAIEDTANRLGLALKVKGDLYPVRETAYKTLLDRAKINGTALPKLSRGTLAGVLNECLHLFESEALVLVRDEKVSAVHSGDKTDYAVLPIDELLETLDGMLGIRFPDSVFTGGYADHSIVSGMWTMPKQKESLLGAYTKMLDKYGISHCDYTPGIRFVTSDTGIASAKVSALLFGGKHPIHIGGCVAVDHRHGATISDFEKAVQIIKKYEGLHQPQHWPLVGYGHKILPGEKFSRTKAMSEADAEALLRKDLLKNCAVFRQFGADSLLLGVLAYNIGSGATLRSSVVSKLKAGNRDIYKNYIAHSRYRGKIHSQIQKRRIEEFETLFIKDPAKSGKQIPSLPGLSAPATTAPSPQHLLSLQQRERHDNNLLFTTTNPMMACLPRYQQYSWL